ncbi:NAC transcription factor 32-like [Malania oleifera]|uniref:NAC transcription factor 32-like n=1 Tax=Malania oleifera TaxID=397392 RepID=UPI0025ADEE61|nr:NAC transcription factor 32-like [Malania oleifera]
MEVICNRNDVNSQHISNGVKEYLCSFPPGYRFIPRDDELIVDYLLKKLIGQPLPPNKIVEVTLYQYNPAHLVERYMDDGTKEYYFFTPRKMKYQKGNRSSRSTNDGYWKATGIDKLIRHGDIVVGFKKVLVFYEGKAPKGIKTNWVMYEYRVNHTTPDTRRAQNEMQLNDWVLCKIYKKREKSDGSINKKHTEYDDMISFSSVDEYLDSFPPGYRFSPLDHELIVHYLIKKVVGGPLPPNKILEVTLYQHNPAYLAGSIEMGACRIEGQGMDTGRLLELTNQSIMMVQRLGIGKFWSSMRENLPRAIKLIG